MDYEKFQNLLNRFQALLHSKSLTPEQAKELWKEIKLHTKEEVDEEKS